MTREDAILCLKGMKIYGRDTFTEQTDWQTSLDMSIKALEQEPNYKSFCEFVAKTIMEEDFELNAGANAEFFCRKLAKLGIVRADGDSWVLESEMK